MRKYFYSDGKEQFGPFTYEELIEKDIQQDTLVWYSGLESWIPAREAEDLKGLFPSIPPPIINLDEEELKSENKELANENIQRGTGHRGLPKTWLVESILVTIFCCLPFGVVGIVFASQVESKYNSGDVLGAEKASQSAGMWTKISFGTGLAFILIYFIMLIAGVVTGSL